jgi:tyrosine-specific transport protein
MNKTFGATLIVAGTTIGAGMLALPIASHSLGTLPALLWLGGIGALMYYAGLIHLEINLFYGRQSASISTLAGRCFGPLSEIFISFITGVLFYALLAAYGVGGASLCHGILKHALGIDAPQKILTLGFICSLGLLTASKMKWVDYTNRLLFFIKIGVFAVLIMRLLPFVQEEKLASAIGSLNLAAIAIFCTSFGFHICIQRLLPYLDYNIKALRRAFFWGTVGSLGLYILWTIITLGIIPSTGPMSFTTVAEAQNDLGDFMAALNHWTHLPLLSLLSNVFSVLAILTSFLGVGMGLLSFIQERVEKRAPSLPSKGQQGVSVILTYGVPLMFALFYPQGFIVALKYAGIAAAILSVTMPAAVALFQRFSSSSSEEGKFKTPGGIPGLGLALGISLTLIGIEFLK